MNFTRRIAYAAHTVATSIRRSWQDSFVRNSTLASILLIVISILVIVWKWNGLPQSVPLWYSRAWGEDQLASPVWLFTLPLGNLVWLSANIILSSLIAEDELFAKLLLVSSLLVSVLSLFTLIRIVLLIT